MAKITIAGDAVVITSSMTLDQIKTLEKYKPKALWLYETNDDGDKELTYAVGTTRGAGSISEAGASFGSQTHDDDGLATITMILPTGIEDVKEYVADRVGYFVMKLNAIEAAVPAALEAVEAEKAAVMENITIA